jgi:hypothetical protein
MPVRHGRRIDVHPAHRVFDQGATLPMLAMIFGAAAAMLVCVVICVASHDAFPFGSTRHVGAFAP